jgi:hypothetical protein
MPSSISMASAILMEAIGSMKRKSPPATDRRKQGKLKDILPTSLGTDKTK